MKSVIDAVQSIPVFHTPARPWHMVDTPFHYSYANLSKDAPLGREMMLLHTTSMHTPMAARQLFSAAHLQRRDAFSQLQSSRQDADEEESRDAVMRKLSSSIQHHPTLPPDDHNRNTTPSPKSRKQRRRTKMTVKPPTWITLWFLLTAPVSILSVDRRRRVTLSLGHFLGRRLLLFQVNTLHSKQKCNSISLLRPRSFEGGDLHWIWAPYSIYQNVSDHPESHRNVITSSRV